MNRISNILALVFLGIFSLGLMHGMIPHIHHSHNHDHQTVSKDDSSHHKHNHYSKNDSDSHHHSHHKPSDKEKDSNVISKFLSQHSHTPHSHVIADFFNDKTRAFQNGKNLATKTSHDFNVRELLINEKYVNTYFNFNKRSYSFLQIDSCPLRGPPSLG